MACDFCTVLSPAVLSQRSAPHVPAELTVRLEDPDWFATANGSQQLKLYHDDIGVQKHSLM